MLNLAFSTQSDFMHHSAQQSGKEESEIPIRKVMDMHCASLPHPGNVTAKNKPMPVTEKKAGKTHYVQMNCWELNLDTVVMKHKGVYRGTLF